MITLFSAFYTKRHAHLIPAVHYYIYYYRSTHYWCDCIERNDTYIARKHTDDIACQSDYGTAEDGGGHEVSVIVGAGYHACDVRHGQSDESHRTAKSRGNSCEQAGGEEQCIAYESDVHAKILGISLAKQQRI